MPKFTSSADKKLLDTSNISESQFWELVKESIISGNSKLQKDLLVYSRINYSNIALDELNNLFNEIPLEDLSNSIDLIKKLGISTSTILNAVLEVNIYNNPKLENLKEELISEIIISESNKFWEDDENFYEYYRNISPEDLKKVKESTLLKNPNAALSIVLSVESQDASLATQFAPKSSNTEFAERLLSNGANINQVLKETEKCNLRTLNELSEYLINDPNNPIDPQLFLDSVLATSTLNYGSNYLNPTQNQELIKMKYDLVQKCADNGASIGNQLSVFFDEGHAFVKLECSNCDQGSAASVYVGLYPPPNMDDNQDKGMSETLLDSTIITGGITGGLSGYLFKQQNTKIDLDEKSETKDRYTIMQEFGGSLSKTSLNFYNNKDGRSYKDLENMPKRRFDITKEAADKLFTRIDNLVNTCDQELEYQVFGSNCMDFAQDTLNQAGLNVDIVEEVHGTRYPQNIFGLYKAIQDTSRAIAGDQSAIGSLMNAPTSPLIASTIHDIAPQIELARVTYPAIAYAAGTAAYAAQSAYKYIFGSKIGEEELNNIKNSLMSTRPPVLKTLNKLRKEFIDIRRETYTRDLEIAKESYDERSYKYTSPEGEEAISRVRFMADLDNEFRDLSKQLAKLVAAQKTLTIDSDDITAKEVVNLDKEISRKITDLAKKDLSIITKNALHKAKLQSLQALLETQEAKTPRKNKLPSKVKQSNHNR